MKTKGLLFYPATCVFAALLLNLNACTKKPPAPPGPKYETMLSYADDFWKLAGEWYNRNGWTYADGGTHMLFRVSYNYFTADDPEAFNAKIDSSKVEDQTLWSQYTSYKPGGRMGEDSESLWTGTRCQGVVYRSAIKAGYSLDAICLNDINSWLNEGTVIGWSSVREGDLILMDLDTAWYNPGYEHLGIIKTKNSGTDSLADEILSAMALYSDPFWYAAGYAGHTIRKYNDILQSERPNRGYKVYNVAYLRLTE